MPTAEKEN